MSTICLDFGTAWCKAAQYLGAPEAPFDPNALRILPLGGEEGVLLATALRVDGDRMRFGPEALALDGGDGSTGARAFPYLSFKALLSAPDLARMLQASAPARFDSSASLTQRDLIVAYLGFALHRVRGSLGLAAQDMTPAFRFTYPAWGLGNDRRRELGGLFNEGALLAQILAQSYSDPGGIGLDALRAALSRVKAEAMPIVTGAVFEALAAATSRMVLETAQTILVVDIGAGTTDFGAFTYRSGQMAEIRSARTTIDLAGDAVDNALLNLLIERAKHVKGATAQGVLWRALSPQMRRFKEALFAQGRASVRCAGAVVTIQRHELERHVGYRAFAEAVTKAFVQALECVRAEAGLGNPAGDITLVLSGGGARLPFLARMVGQARPKKGPRLRIITAPLHAPWCNAPCFEGQLAPVFPQLCVAIGGAMAGQQLVAPMLEPVPIASPPSGVA